MSHEIIVGSETPPDPPEGVNFWMSIKDFQILNDQWKLAEQAMLAQIDEWRRRAFDAEKKLHNQIEENLYLRGVVMENKKLEKIIAEQAYKFQFEKMTLWEEHLRLLIRPRPPWMPTFFYNWMVRQILRQEIQKIPKSSL